MNANPPKKTLANFPVLVAQWHPSKNGSITPMNVAYGSTTQYWWRCPVGPDHEWKASPNVRTNTNRKVGGCPYCRGYKVSQTNSLAELFPDIAKQWHPTRNGSVIPGQVVAGSGKQYWWKCTIGPDHEWKTGVRDRTRKDYGCPYCSGKKVSVTNSIRTLYPSVAKQWHSTKNGKLTPDRVLAGSHSRYWWKCTEGPDHEWVTAVRERTTGGTGCPFCGNDRVSITNSLSCCFPNIAAEWHPTKNGKKTPDQIVSTADQYAWWRCPTGPDHEWRAIVYSRTKQKSGCPFCDGKKVSVTNSLAALFPDVAKEWHPEKNGELKPDGVGGCTQKSYWWKCPKGPDHEWRATVANRTFAKSGCPFCRGLKVSVTNSLANLFPAVAKQWHPVKNGKLTSHDVVAGTNRKYWWKCTEGPDHEWVISVNDRTYGQYGCPYCAGQKVSVTNSLAALFPKIAKQWHHKKNGKDSPDAVTSKTNKKVWWNCPINSDHEWPATIASRTFMKSGCPFCTVVPRSKTELYLAFELFHFFDIDMDAHKINSPEGLLDVDIIIDAHKLVVEFDGRYFHKGKEDFDRKKAGLLEEMGWRVIRVRESPLEPLSPSDIQVPINATPKMVANRVLGHLATKLNISIPGLEDYKKRHSSINTKAAEHYIDQLLTRQSGQPNSSQGKLPLMDA
jgi:hypothetical protein